MITFLPMSHWGVGRLKKEEKTMRKSVNTIRDEAVPFVKGIKNLDVFIEDENDN